MLFKLFCFFIDKSKATLFVLLLAFVCLFKFSFNLQVDASSETLMLNNDSDLAFARKMAKRYETPNFLVLTYTPNSPLLSKKSLDNLKNLNEKLKSVKQISSTICILNTPLLQSPIKPIEELVKKLPNLSEKGIDLELVKKEFLTSPLYKNTLVSADFKTTAIVINLKDDKKYTKLLNARNELEDKGKTDTKEYKNIQKEFKAHRDKQRQIDSNTIKQIRQIIANNDFDAKVFLGGVNMIADDMISFVKNDILLYGSSLFILLSLTLFIIFRQIHWVFLSLAICTICIFITTGILGFFDFEITVISSNFISLQLIITLSIVLHLIVCYNQNAKKYTKTSQKRLILATLLRKADPSFFAVITTISGFLSLIFSNIKPIINLGFMMSLGISISLILSFILFASLTSLMKKQTSTKRQIQSYTFSRAISSFVLADKKFILTTSFVLFFIALILSKDIEVENSFINYFKSSTEIYKSMEVIDKKLGGTTPLDVIVSFKQTKQTAQDFDEFENEFAENKNEAKYWFSRPKIELIQKVSKYLQSRPEIGSVQSFDTLLSIGKTLNKNEELNSFLIAVMYDKMPKNYKKMIISPFVSIKDNEVRFSTRVIDSNPSLKRDEFIQTLKKDLANIIPEHMASFRLSSFMILYNNMLQSLYKSQILTLGFVVLLLAGMFFILFKNLKLATIAITSNVIPLSLLFAFMSFFNIPLDMMSITIAAISIGIGVDDTIHYIHCFKDEFNKSKDYKLALKTSHDKIGYAMLYTSLAIILGFSVLVISNFIPIIYFALLTILVMSLVLVGALFLLPKLILVIKPFKV